MAARRSVAVITGGTRGLGRSLSLEFGHRGFFVLALYSANEEAARHLTEAFRRGGIEGTCVRHDVSTELPEGAAAEWTYREEIRSAEQLVLINNACAPFEPRPFHLLEWKDFEGQWQVGVKGSVLCTALLLRSLLRADRATIINVLSQAAEGEPPKGYAAYVTSKAALRGLTRALASEYAPRGIRVFSVSPGFMETDLTAAWDGRLKQAILSRGAAATPEHVALRIALLALDPGVPGRGEHHRIHEP